MMVVVVLLSIVMVAMMGLFLTTLKSGGKATTLARVKEEGDYAITTIERLLRYQQDAPICNNVVDDHITTVDSSSPPVTQVIEWDGSNQRLQITVTPPGVTRILTTIENVRVTGAEFKCNPGSPTSGDTVEIKLTVAGHPDATVLEVFRSKVILRNY
jgi:Tfp pilus assembly protein PilW